VKPLQKCAFSSPYTIKVTSFSKTRLRTRVAGFLAKIYRMFVQFVAKFGQKIDNGNVFANIEFSILDVFAIHILSILLIFYFWQVN